MAGDTDRNTVSFRSNRQTQQLRSRKLGGLVPAAGLQTEGRKAWEVSMATAHPPHQVTHLVKAQVCVILEFKSLRYLASYLAHSRCFTCVYNITTFLKC